MTAGPEFLLDGSPRRSVHAGIIESLRHSLDMIIGSLYSIMMDKRHFQRKVVQMPWLGSMILAQYNSNTQGNAARMRTSTSTLSKEIPYPNPPVQEKCRNVSQATMGEL